MDYTVHGILQARILEWVAFPFSRGSSKPRDRTQLSCIAGGVLTSWATREAQAYWSGWPIPSPANLPDPGVKQGSPALQVNSLPTELSGLRNLYNGWAIFRFCLRRKNTEILCNVTCISPGHIRVHEVAGGSKGHHFKNNHPGDFPGGPVVKTSPSNAGVPVWSLVGELSQ